MNLVKLTLMLLPFLALLSNYFKIHQLPEGVLMLTPVCLLLLSLGFPTKYRTQSATTPRIIITLFFSYIFFSSLYVVLDTPELGIKPVLVQGLSFSLCLWILISNHLNKENLTRYFSLYCQSTFVIAIIYILIVIPVLLSHSGGRGWAFVSTEVLPNRNDMSLFFLVALCGFVFLDFKISRKLKLIAIAVIVVALFLTFSRSSYLSLFLLSFYFILKSKHRMGMIFAFIVVIILITSIDGNPIVNRLEYTFAGSTEGEYDDSTSLRVVIWDHALNLAFENPIFGVGHGRSPFWDSDYVGEHAAHIIFAHNYFITQFFQLGIIGLLLTFFVFAMVPVMAKRLPAGERNFVIATLTLFLIMSMSGDPMYGYSKFIFILLYSTLLNSITVISTQSPNISDHSNKGT